MITTTVDENDRPAFDQVLLDIADYVLNHNIASKTAYQTAHWCLMDTLGCGLLALRYPACCRHLGPKVPGTTVPHGARVPGTQLVLDPITAAFNIGVMNRWLDFNDTWLAAEWGHPSDNLAGLLAVADHENQQRRQRGQAPILLNEVLTALIKAYEIQGILALQNSFNAVGLDHVVLVKVASTAVITAMLGGNKEQILNALSLAWVDGQSLRTYRHAPNTGPRKSWAAGDAAARAVQFAYMAMAGEPGYPSALSASQWGFYDVNFAGKAFSVPQAYGSYVIENILFKISYPAEFHSQTALECAITLHNKLKTKQLEHIDSITLHTHASAIRIISKTGPLHNPADRDHCLQYIVAIGLLHGTLNADHYEDAIARDPRIDALRDKMNIKEDVQYSEDYLAADKRYIANRIEISFNDGSSPLNCEVHYPIGHRLRREEGIPLLEAKFAENLATRFPTSQTKRIIDIFANTEQLGNMPIDTLMDELTI